MDVRLTLTLGTSPQDTIILISVVQYSVGLTDISRIRGGAGAATHSEKQVARNEGDGK
jgi:hypothetical protein